MRIAGMALVVLGGCGYVVRGGLGPTRRDDGKIGAQAGIEIGTHLIASPESSMPFSLRAQAGFCDGSATMLIAAAASLDLGPGFWHERSIRDRGAGFAGRFGMAGGVGAERGVSGAGRFDVSVGYGTVEATDAEGPMRVEHLGLTLAWQPMFDRDGVARWSSAAEVYWQLSRVPDETLAAALGVTK
jgi:hypothetical protein